MLIIVELKNISSNEASIMKAPKRKSFEGIIVRWVALAGMLPSVLLFYLLIDAPISIYVKILTVIIVVTVVSYVCFIVWLKINHQFRTLTNLLEAIVVGDGSMRASRKFNDGALAEFNLVLNGVTKALNQQKQSVKEQQLLLAKVIEQIDVAIIATDVANNIVLVNPSAEKLFSCRFEQVKGGPLNQLGLQHVMTQDVRKVVEFELAQYAKKVYLHTDNYLAHGQQHKLIFITDIQRLLRDEERQAWQRLVRVLSHEINNSLAPIASISESLKRISQQDLSMQEVQIDLQEGLSVISERAQSLNSFIRSYQQLSALPSPSKLIVNLSEFIAIITALYPTVNWHVEGDSLVQVYIDSQQMQQALVNLITNAIEASSSGNSEKIPLTIRWKALADKIVVELLDCGSGIANVDNLFVPFYSTKKEGSGIGLVLSRQIIMNHDGDLQLKNRDTMKGVNASIYLPINKAY